MIQEAANAALAQEVVSAQMWGELLHRSSGAARLALTTTLMALPVTLRASGAILANTMQSLAAAAFQTALFAPQARSMRFQNRLLAHGVQKAHTRTKWARLHAKPAMAAIAQLGPCSRLVANSLQASTIAQSRS